MPFRVAARTILHLGAELISSDAVAFYELIKNAFDAGSRKVEIRIVNTLPMTVVSAIKHLSSKSRHTDKEFRDLRKEVVQLANSASRFGRQLEEEAERSDSPEELLNAARSFNYVEIEDFGEGMSKGDLDEVYLTIGTRSRFLQREAQKAALASDGARPDRPILGEKGVGRLSAMRLGNELSVRTTKKDDSRWNVLDIDWDYFSHNTDELLENISVTPHYGERKQDVQYSGTIIRITGLNADWSETKVHAIAREQLSKFTDPFEPELRFPIVFHFNGDIVAIPRFDKTLLENAHALMTADFVVGKHCVPKLKGRVIYRRKHRQKTFDVESTHLASVAETSSDTMLSLGPFQLAFYWFNRQQIETIDGIGTPQQVRDLLKNWAGGIMVFRDGFRVHPYGDPDDDWLGLDRRALAAQGYKVNRNQIVAKLDISAYCNPQLVDQTNREGLRDCPEKDALKALLRHLIYSEFKAFLDSVDAEAGQKEPVSVADLERRVSKGRQELKKSLTALVSEFPGIKNSPFIEEVEGAIERLRKLLSEVTVLADSYDRGRTQLLHLAGLGLMIEVVGHELNRAAAHALSTVARANKGQLPRQLQTSFDTLEAQLKTLQKRLKVLDPLSTSGRQVRENFEFVSWVKAIIDSHKEQFERHNIDYKVRVLPSKDARLEVHVVKGMIVQVLENLIINSVYWLTQEARVNSRFEPQMEFIIDVEQEEIRVSDNGPGIEVYRKDEVFQPFFTTKPPGEGKGLGLYISREVATYNGATLGLSDAPRFHDSMLDTFVFALGAAND